jgi:plastocyanin
MKRISVTTLVATAMALFAYISISNGTRASAAASQGPTGSARVVVKVVLTGSAPARAKIQTSADPYCAKVHQAEPLLSQTVEVGADGALIDALVFVKDGATGTYAVPQTPVTLDQKGCVYIPHVMGMRAGQPLVILNSDATLHNIHPMPVINAGFNIGMPVQGMKQTRFFQKVEPVFHVKCDVHPWMSAYIATFAHPFFGVSNGQGTVELGGLPAGTFQIQAWHEKYGAQVQTVSVAAGETKQLTFTYKGGA